MPGNTSAIEAFAESSALYHVGREALRRIHPAVVGFFEQGGHPGER